LSFFLGQVLVLDWIFTFFGCSSVAFRLETGLIPAYQGLFLGSLCLVWLEVGSPGAVLGCFRNWWGLKPAYQARLWGVFVPGAFG